MYEATSYMALAYAVADTTDKSNSALMSNPLEMQGWPASEVGIFQIF